MDAKRLTVTELTRYIKLLLESDRITGHTVAVVGEVSGANVGPRGHIYFSLKDSGAALDCAVWASSVSRLRYKPRNGDKILALGRLDLYAPQGRYKLVVNQVQPVGTGDIMAELEALKQRLTAEGIFAQEHKKPLPAFPKTIGIITSATGAALQDMVRVAKARNPRVQLIFHPAKVQGEGAAAEIAAAIDYFSRENNADVVVCGRGGGSVEDLWEFNREIVARAIYNCRVPIISAVGHETDYTLADFAADVRAATPSNAMELAVPDTAELGQKLRQLATRLRQAAYTKIRYRRTQLEGLRKSRTISNPTLLLADKRQRLELLAERLAEKSQGIIEAKRQRTVLQRERLALLDPMNLLCRGYGIVSGADGKLLRSVSGVQAGDGITVRLSDGELTAEVEAVK
ncbi:MAG: exodeoxyribonuclease VII large subunit [Selenomonadaceae bacterium]|nr:exodeoxyribonuclease VII large subunit [Selenomonadaceae bacterium]